MKRKKRPTCLPSACRSTPWGRTCDASGGRRAAGCSWSPGGHFWRCSCSSKSRKTLVTEFEGSAGGSGSSPAAASAGSRPPCVAPSCRWSCRRGWRRRSTRRRPDWSARPSARSRATPGRTLSRFQRGAGKTGTRTVRTSETGSRNSDEPEFSAASRRGWTKQSRWTRNPEKTKIILDPRSLKQIITGFCWKGMIRSDKWQIRAISRSCIRSKAVSLLVLKKHWTVQKPLTSDQSIVSMKLQVSQNDQSQQKGNNQGHHELFSFRGKE